MAMVLANDEADYAIKPEASTPALDTSSWPLLLKGYDKCKYQFPFAKLNWDANCRQYSFGQDISPQSHADAHH
jgi:hypothetical protein